MRPAVNITVLTACMLLLSFCAPSRFVKPLAHRQQAFTGTFGGPVIRYGSAAIPLPFSTVGYAYGVLPSVTGFFNVHSTSLLFGNVQCDLGASILLSPANRTHGLSFSPALQFATHPGVPKSTRMWPSADLNYFMQLRSKPSFVYAGLNAWFEAAGRRAHSEPQPRHMIPNAHVGLQLVKPKWDHQFELKYLGMGINNLPGVVGYVGVAGKGSFGIYYSCIKKF